MLLQEQLCLAVINSESQGKLSFTDTVAIIALLLRHLYVTAVA